MPACEEVLELIELWKGSPLLARDDGMWSWE